ncbi:aminopeptidase P family protein [Micropruina sonneratiae]|uniref:aminopeptidase P family protein n=1 Tax=Micropruina sonneratiae TaxID=2986940 RepID=UPI002227E3C6|nr:aminopeptidase P family protein [Micropruina sp. KQZ13P-5]MCW3156767.1 aminopeptidase P family protein [Micropruina sp. KQZ13P-5]
MTDQTTPASTPDPTSIAPPESGEDQQLPNRQTRFSEPFKEFIPTGWAPYSDQPPQPLPATCFTAARRQAISAQFPGDRLVIPAGELKVRSNDTDYRYRPHSAFAHLTGLGTDREPGAVLVLEPTDQGHDATLYFKPRAPRTDPEFYADARYGEMWVGQRESLPEMEALTGLACAPLSQLPDALSKNAGATRVLVVADADAELTASLTAQRASIGASSDADADEQLAVALSELRLVKDAFEADEMRAACDATADGFEAVVASLPEAVRRGRGERWVEGVFGLYARHAGNAVGYDTIAAAGDHANTLHWIDNDGDLRPGDLLLLDAGVERDSLYTADITRTLPVTGTFSPAQRRVYDAVLAAQTAGIAAARPGATFSDVHDAAIRVIAEHLHEWGLLPVSVEQTLDPDNGGHHRRWMVHGTSHHLGIDVHDCAQARNSHYREGTLAPGMVITVEPGLYFRSTDLLVPEELRGIGVRIEDDVLITQDGCEVLSARLPRSADDVEAWMARILDNG